MDFIERKVRSRRTWRQRLKGSKAQRLQAPPVPRKEGNLLGYLTLWLRLVKGRRKAFWRAAKKTCPALPCPALPKNTQKIPKNPLSTHQRPFVLLVPLAQHETPNSHLPSPISHLFTQSRGAGHSSPIILLLPPLHLSIMFRHPVSLCTHHTTDTLARPHQCHVRMPAHQNPEIPRFSD